MVLVVLDVVLVDVVDDVLVDVLLEVVDDVLVVVVDTAVHDPSPALFPRHASL